MKQRWRRLRAYYSANIIEEDRDAPPQETHEKGEEARKRKQWENLNFWLEEIPQFVVLTTLVGMINADEFLVCETFLDSDDAAFDHASAEEECDEEEKDYISDLELDAFISFVLTTIMIVKAFTCFRRRGFGVCDSHGSIAGRRPSPDVCTHWQFTRGKMYEHYKAECHNTLLHIGYSRNHGLLSCYRKTKAHGCLEFVVTTISIIHRMISRACIYVCSNKVTFV
jgi:hypothetical protein